MLTHECPSWYRERRYLHFDEPLGLSKAHELVSNPERVAKHAFWPLINYTIKTVKLKKIGSLSGLKKIPKDRPIAYASHSDSHILSYYCHQLSSLYEARLTSQNLSDNVLAFRSLAKSNINFAGEAFAEIRQRGNCDAVALDITKFFDTLDHKILKECWLALLDKKQLPNDHYAVYRAITKFSVVHRERLFEILDISKNNPRNGRRRICSPKEFRNKVRGAGLIEVNKSAKGIPQGSAISALLSNLYMLDFDVAAKSFADSINGRYMRYCDDILFIVPSGLSVNVENFANAEIKKIHLDINPCKTITSQFLCPVGKSHQESNRPLQYLGFLFDGQRILIRSAAFAKFSNRMKRGIRLAKATAESRNKVRVGLDLVAKDIYKRKLLARYSHLGGRNFLRYGYRAAHILKSKKILRQLKPLWGRLQIELASK